MDLRTVLTISTLLLMTPGSGHAIPLNGLETTTTGLNSSTTSHCFCPSATACPPPPTPAPCPTYNPPAPVIGFLTITWKDCEGTVELKTQIFNSSVVPVCHDSLAVKSLLGSVCDKKGCDGKPVWSNHIYTMKGYSIKEGGTMEEKGCITLKVRCAVEGQGQLQAYKVVIALLCCVLIVLLLIRFTRPTVKALQKRLSDRRQSRWIGPTQSHSVSYHRGKTAVKNNDGEKRLSYPALERLTVSNSREPSSNRNSDCNY